MNFLLPVWALCAISLIGKAIPGEEFNLIDGLIGVMCIGQYNVNINSLKVSHVVSLCKRHNNYRSFFNNSCQTNAIEMK